MTKREEEHAKEEKPKKASQDRTSGLVRCPLCPFTGTDEQVSAHRDEAHADVGTDMENEALS